MLKESENETLTRVGPGTAAGTWLRKYWLPIAISDKWNGVKTLWKCEESFSFKGKAGTVAGLGEQLGTFSGNPTAVRILCEDLVLFRDGSDRLGLLGLHCPHRHTSLEYGRVRKDGLECCYHGWRFDVDGKCIDQPAEPSTTPFKHKAYPVREMGGLIWSYLGAGQAPVLPKLDVVAREDGIRALENWGLWPCNYFQFIEQATDATHTGILHASGGERSDIWRDIPKLTWKEDEFGIVTTQSRPSYERATHFIMPTTIRLAQPWPGGKFKWPRYSALMRTPVDDTHTLAFHVTFTPFVNGVAPELPEGLTFDITDQLHTHRLQDYQAIISQEEIFDRTTEKLGRSDDGIIIFRKMIMDAIETARKGGDPKGVWRTAEMDKILDFSHDVIDDLMTRKTG